MKTKKQLVNDAPLGIIFKDDSQIFNPLDNIPEFMAEHPELFYTWLLSRPEYFWLTCKVLLNVEIHVMQGVILQNLWTHKFPMLIGSRGLGKCTSQSTLIMTDDRICRIDKLITQNTPEMIPDYKTNMKMLGENGFKDVAYSWDNGISDTKKITTRFGYKIEGTHNHPIRIVDGENIVWKNLEDIHEGDYTVIDRSTTWFNPSSNITDDEAYAMGLIVGDGGYTIDSKITFTTADEELIDSLNRISVDMFGKPFKKQGAKYQYLLSGKEIRESLFSRYGFNSPICGEKDFPSSVLGASKSAVASFIQGLMDTDGTVDDIMVQFAAKSEDIVRTLQFVLTRFGIISCLKAKYNKKYSRYYYYLNISGPAVRIFEKEIGFRLARKKEKLAKLCEKKSNSNVDVIPDCFIKSLLLRLRDKYIKVRKPAKKGYNYERQFIAISRIQAYECTYTYLDKFLDMTKELSDSEEWIKLDSIRSKNYFFDKVESIDDGNCRTYDVHIPEDHSFISNGFISHNTFILAVYALLRILLLKDRKIIICGSGFRQSKILFGYMENIVQNSPILRSIITPDDIIHGNDGFKMKCGNSFAMAIPIGCMSPDTLVTTSNGIKRLINLRENADKNIVYSSTGFKQQGFFYDSGISPAINIITKDGYEYTATPNHKVKVLFDGEVIWMRTDELKLGHKLLIDISERWFDNGLECEDDKVTRLGLALAEDDLDEKIQLRQEWGLIVDTKYEQELSDKILSLSRDKMIVFLKAFFKKTSFTTRYRSNNFYNNSKRYKQNKQGIIFLLYHSEKLIKQIQYILLHFGIASKIGARTLKIVGDKYIYRFNNIIGSSNELVAANINNHLIDYKDTPDTKTYISSAIISIDKSVDQPMYDINIPDGNEYIANGFISHNTGEKVRGLRANDVLADELACIRQDSVIQTDIGLIEIGDYLKTNAYQVLNMNNQMETPANIIKTPLTEVYKITTVNGYSFCCSKIHKVMTINGWKVAKDLTSDDVLPLDNNDYFPSEYVYQDGIKLDAKIAYLQGISSDLQTIPKDILLSPRNVVNMFIHGLSISCQALNSDHYISSPSNRFIDVIQILLLKFNIKTRKTNDNFFFALDLVFDNVMSDQVKSVELLPDKEHLYDFYLPNTHSFYANGFTQHNSIPIDIFETVVQGFAATSSSPTVQASNIAKQKMAKTIKLRYDNDNDSVIGNQIVLSGTASYSFNHFSHYHDRYLQYIRSRGDSNKLKTILGDNYKDFNWKDYCILRIPVDMVPEGFMDPAQIARAKATVNTGIYQMEYGAVFSSDSNGFFKRSLIEACVARPEEDVVQPNGSVIPYEKAFFTCLLSGDKTKSYIMGIDPAMTQDNFSIVIIELDNKVRKIVYCWTTNKDDHKQKLSLGLVTENNYFAYCARKIRGLMERFNIAYIAIDTAGGGRMVMESLNDKNLIRPGELELWPIVDPTKPKDTDYFQGRHIIDPIVFTREEWTTGANHGLKKDMEDKVLLFPYFDAVSVIDADYVDYKSDNEDTLIKCIEEIEELKNELCTITVSQTAATNRERWDTPEFKLPNGKKGRMRKDRYSSLLMANMTARTVERMYQYDIQTVIGGFAKSSKNDTDTDMFKGNPLIASKLNALYGGLV